MIDEDAQQYDSGSDHQCRGEMPDRDRRQRSPNHSPALPVQAERHGKQPPHARVQPVERAKAQKRQPRPNPSLIHWRGQFVDWTSSRWGDGRG